MNPSLLRDVLLCLDGYADQPVLERTREAVAGLVAGEAEMVERVAMALARHHNWDLMAPRAKDNYRDAARAAIEAMVA